MARDSGGTWSAPTGQPVVSGTVITATAQNTLVTDLGTEITDSLSRSGKGGMTAPIKVANGSVGAPSYAFTNDAAVGIYRSASGEASGVAGGSARWKWSSSGFYADDILGLSSGRTLLDTYAVVSADATESAGTQTQYASFAIGANETWKVSATCVIEEVGGSTTVFQIDGPSSPTMVSSQIHAYSGATDFDTGFGAGGTITAGVTQTLAHQQSLAYIIVNGANAGTVSLKFAKAGGTSSTLKKGSFVAYRRLA